jgi:hypothetical protein
VDALGTFAFAPIMFWNLYTREPGPFWMVLVIAALVLDVELLYFERETLEEEIEHLESAATPADSIEAADPGDSRE